MATVTDPLTGTGALDAAWRRADGAVAELTRDGGVRVPSLGYGFTHYRDDIACAGEQFSEIELAVFPTGEWGLLGALKGNIAGAEGYDAVLQLNNRIVVRRQGAGVRDITGLSLVPTDKVRVTATVNPGNAAHLDIKVFVNGTQIGTTYTDTSPLTGTRIGLTTYYGDPAYRGINFVGGDITPPDTAAPTLTGTPTVTNYANGSGTFDADWSDGTDNVAVTQWRWRAVISGTPGSWNVVGASQVTGGTGLTPGATTTIEAQAGDAAGNWSSTITSASFVPGVAPSFSVHPASGSYTDGATINLTATSSGTPAPTHQWQRSTNGGSSWADIGGAVSAGYSFAAVLAETGYLYRRRDSNAVQANVASNAATITVTGSGDGVLPTLTGAIAVGAVTQTTIPITHPAGADNVAVVSYEYSADGGSTWHNSGSTSTSYTFTQANHTLVPGSTVGLRVRARDPAGNVSTPPLAASVTLPTYTATFGPFGNNTGNGQRAAAQAYEGWLFPGVRIGQSLAGVTPVVFSGTLNGSGLAVVTGLTVPGACEAQFFFPNDTGEKGTARTQGNAA
jgi:hypothetical protein